HWPIVSPELLRTPQQVVSEPGSAWWGSGKGSCQKLKMLKDKLKIWNKDTFGNVHNMVKQAEIKLKVVQDRIDSDGHSELLLNLEKSAQLDLNNALNIEEMFWYEKSRINWHIDGDRNTKYFHRMAKIKSSTKMINAIRDGDTVLTEPSEVAIHIVNHFQNLFSSNIVLQGSNLVEEVIPNLVDDQINNMITSIPSSEEIKNAVFSLNKDSAPGPDGFGGFFYQTYWDIIHKDVCDAVIEFFRTSYLLPN
ncbi:RNA-directed DNA polymerase (Reverse transcriptase), partial [Trifolium medium]|nr:RNA-directed DNA polymerase (Reverse transcriptase) [Trifolium medium]